MVALNENFAPEKPAPRSKNRVGNFFSGTPDCVGSDRPATRNRIGEKRPCSYDIASGVTYYGFRYYDPVTGRWPNRDPLGDFASKFAGNLPFPTIPGDDLIGLYAFVSNNSLNSIDLLGLACFVEFSCSLSAESGDCDKDCNYTCTVTNKQERKFGTVFCDDVPDSFPDFKAASGISILGCCLKEGKCDKSFDDVALYLNTGPIFPCSKSDCTSGCKNTARINKRLCKHPACKIAIAATKRACIAACQLCDNP